VQYIYESNIRFEHCYRLDYDEHIAPPHRRACWAEWLSLYSTRQTRDRVDYAQRRIRAIDSGDGMGLKLQNLDGTDASLARGAPDPVPTSVHAPPPARIEVPEPGNIAVDTSGAGVAGAPGTAEGEASPRGVAGAAAASSAAPRASRPNRRSGR
jgi:hypothetical protein